GSRSRGSGTVRDRSSCGSSSAWGFRSSRRCTPRAFCPRATPTGLASSVEINYEEWLGDLPVLHLSDELADADKSVDVTNAVGPLDAALQRLASIPSV